MNTNVIVRYVCRTGGGEAGGRLYSGWYCRILCEKEREISYGSGTSKGIILTGETFAAALFMNNAFKSMTGPDPYPEERDETKLDDCQIYWDEYSGE